MTLWAAALVVLALVAVVAVTVHVHMKENRWERHLLLELHKQMVNIVENEIRYDKAKVNASVRGRGQEVARRVFALPVQHAKLYDFVLNGIPDNEQCNVRVGVIKHWCGGWSAVVIIEQV